MDNIPALDDPNYVCDHQATRPAAPGTRLCYVCALGALDAAAPRLKRLAELEARSATAKAAVLGAAQTIEQAADAMEGHQAGCIVVADGSVMCGWGCNAAKRDQLKAMATQLRTLA